MNAVLFDPMLFSRILRDKGHFTPEQTDDLTEALGAATHADLATKADLKSEITSAKVELKAEIATVRAELKTDIAAVRAEIAEARSEIATVRAELKTDIANVRTEIAALRADIGAIKADILKWVVGAIGFQTVATLGTVIALVRIFAK